MRKTLAAAALIASLSGCVTEEQLKKERDADMQTAASMCSQAGYKVGTQNYAACVMMAATRMQEQRSAAREERSAKMAQIGQALQDMDAPQPMMSSPTYTTCNKFGTIVRCTSY